jgi:hypothetical protein
MFAFKQHSTEETTRHQKDLNKKEEEDEKREQKVIKMVVLNGLFNFILRTPDMLFWLENANTWQFFLNDVLHVFINRSFNTLAMYFPGFLSFIADIGYLTYILTFTTNFIIFYKFNTKFKNAVGLFSDSSKPTFNPQNDVQLQNNVSKI